MPISIPENLLAQVKASAGKWVHFLGDDKYEIFYTSQFVKANSDDPDFVLVPEKRYAGKREEFESLKVKVIDDFRSDDFVSEMAKFDKWLNSTMEDSADFAGLDRLVAQPEPSRRPPVESSASRARARVAVSEKKPAARARAPKSAKDEVNAFRKNMEKYYDQDLFWNITEVKENGVGGKLQNHTTKQTSNYYVEGLPLAVSNKDVDKALSQIELVVEKAGKEWIEETYGKGLLEQLIEKLEGSGKSEKKPAKKETKPREKKATTPPPEEKEEPAKPAPSRARRAPAPKMKSETVVEKEKPAKTKMELAPIESDEEEEESE